MELAQLRKVYTVIVAGIVMFALARLDMTPADFAVYGVHMGDLQEALVDMLMQIGIPAAFMVAQPNEKGDSIWRHWRWIIGGLAIVAGLLLIVVGLGWIF